MMTDGDTPHTDEALGMMFVLLGPDRCKRFVRFCRERGETERADYFARRFADCAERMKEPAPMLNGSP